MRRCLDQPAVALAILAASALFPQALLSQDTTVTRWVTEARVKLREEPSTSAGTIRTLSSGVELELVRPGSFRRDFYHVVTTEGDTGWVGFAYVRPADSAALSIAAAASVETEVVGLDNPASEVDVSWPKPRLRRSVFVGSSGRRCQAEGTAGSDWRTNVRKNRPDVPERSNAITSDALADTVTLPFARGGLPLSREGWTDEETLEVARYEGIPVTVTGYFFKIKPQSSNAEDTNCDMTGEANTDWHIAFTGSHDGIEEESVVIEPTPRFKKRHSSWKRGTLRNYEADRRSAGDSVRITGYLFYDPSHKNHLDRFRATMWETHPITRIEIFREGAWVNIDDLR